MDWVNHKSWYVHDDDTAYTKYRWEPTACTTAYTTFSDATTFTCDSSTITGYISKAEMIYDQFQAGTIVGAMAANIYFGVDAGIHFTSVPETEEQRVARMAMEEKYAAEVREADRMARRLFIRIVGPEKYRLMKRLGHFDIVGKTGQRYRLAVGQKVRVMHGCFGDQVKHQLCAYVPDVPQVDTLVAQYLALTSGESGEEEFKKVAIKHAA